MHLLKRKYNSKNFNLGHKCGHVEEKRNRHTPDDIAVYANNNNNKLRSGLVFPSHYNILCMISAPPKDRVAMKANELFSEI